MDEIDVTQLMKPLLSGRSIRWSVPTIRKTAVYLMLLVVAVGGLALVLISPILLRQLDRTRGINWPLLSNIGQTYGAASAILSAVALLGISISLLVQARQAKTERVRIMRERQMELLRITLDSPDIYGPIVGARGQSALDARRHIYITMWMNHARMNFETGELSQESLRAEFCGLMFE